MNTFKPGDRVIITSTAPTYWRHWVGENMEPCLGMPGTVIAFDKTTWSEPLAHVKADNDYDSWWWAVHMLTPLTPSKPRRRL